MFDGVKMGAQTRLNGSVIDVMENQFLRHSFELPPSHLRSELDANNTLEVAFQANIDEEGRFAACTGGWDWAPCSCATKFGKNGNVSNHSKGIWKSVCLRRCQQTIWPFPT